MNVPNEFLQIRISLYENRAVPSFEQMPRTMHFLIGRPRVLTRDEAHEARQRSLMTLNRHVHMVSHPAIGMDTVHVYTEPNFNQRFPAMPIIVIKKYGLTVVTAQNDVIQTTRQVQSGFSRHRPDSQKKVVLRLVVLR